MSDSRTSETRAYDVKRYDFSAAAVPAYEYCETAEGEWVRYEDIKHLLRPASETFVPLRAPDAQGWTLDNRLIRAIHDECRGDDFCPSDEGIELVLLAFEKLTARRLADYGPALKALPPQCSCDPNPSIGGSPPCPVHDVKSEDVQ